ncbi:PREDICTED: 28S ribosomal protein S10, mitochondrial [Nicrophorus vespilloides]|uniref:Small ribosomal subunit protein uS10m n=1 Tax=Nicrophorus vespilloides TaxID=110193 RepID=A0ABM1NA80_NICVS|nr:PREDICTED: 28S ribosomal protein S10, mitochondrial [Nicrophorus vespilloides]
MNILKTTASRFLRLPNITSNFKYATAVETASKPQEVNEPIDKLYKTIELELRGNDSAVLNSFAKFATTAGKHLDVQSKSWNMRKPVHEKFTVLKSVHIYKKHRVQYEFRTYFTFVQYKHLTGSTADTLLEYVERNIPEGVALKATKVELQLLPDHLEPPKAE